MKKISIFSQEQGHGLGVGIDLHLKPVTTVKTINHAVDEGVSDGFGQLSSSYNNAGHILGLLIVLSGDASIRGNLTQGRWLFL